MLFMHSGLLTITCLQIRAFVKNLEGTAKQELNQSPLPFIESREEPGDSSIFIFPLF